MSAATVAPLGDGDERPVVAYVVAAQADPARHVSIVGSDAVSVGADLAAAADWRARTFVARNDVAEIIGVLTVDVDDDLGRLWWMGPWADDDVTAHQLLAAAEAVADGIGEREFAPDARNTDLARLAVGLGYRAEEASAVLVVDLTSWDAEEHAPSRLAEVRALEDEDEDAVARLHDLLFPRTHTPGRDLVRADDTDVLVVGDPMRGYVATQVQADGGLYVDFLGVEPSARGRGLGRALVVEALRRATHEGVRQAAITVRVGNRHARALYEAVGFSTEREVVPHRLGFSLDRRR